MNKDIGPRTAAECLQEGRAIGNGAFGVVYKAQHRNWGTVAFKRLSGEEYVEKAYAFTDLMYTAIG